MNYSTVITPVRTKAITGFTRGRGKLGRAKLGSVTQEKKLANMRQLLTMPSLRKAVLERKLNSTVYSEKMGSSIFTPGPSCWCGESCQREEGFCD